MTRRAIHWQVFLALTALAVVLLSPARAIQNAGESIATPAYERSMRTLSMMEKLDADGDHHVSRDELDAYFGKVFDALDRNRDGALDRTEWVGAAGSGAVVELSNGGYARALASSQMMRICDADRDRLVTRQEFIAAHEAMYDYMAAGRAGTLDAQQWVARHFPN